MVFNVLFKIGFTEVFQVIKIEEKELSYPSHPLLALKQYREIPCTKIKFSNKDFFSKCDQIVFCAMTYRKSI